MLEAMRIFRQLLGRRYGQHRGAVVPVLDSGCIFGFAGSDLFKVGG